MSSMPTVDHARSRLQSAEGEEDPVDLPLSVLSHLTRDDLPKNVSIQIGVMKEGCLHLTWDGRIYNDGAALVGEANHTWTRKYWYAQLNLEPYLDLVRRAVETRYRTHGDVKVTYHDDDGAFIHLTYAIYTTDHNIRQAFETIQKISSEIEETAQQAADEVGTRIAEIAARLSGWGSDNLDTLVDRISTSTSNDEKGRSLEELCSRLFDSVTGFVVTGRVRTETEEIDISYGAVSQRSVTERLKRADRLALALSLDMVEAGWCDRTARRGWRVSAGQTFHDGVRPADRLARFRSSGGQFHFGAGRLGNGMTHNLCPAMQAQPSHDEGYDDILT
ncbi:hypothetical protein [Acetobacter syzygii]|uniref:hypothetical protein n=1 Tax=Acetobacter syzygii TaxID=146476 RepID=UPI0039ED21E2